MVEIEMFHNLALSTVNALLCSDYTPPFVLEGCDKDKYAVKLSERAIFLLYKDADEIEGFVAFYENDRDSVIYISLITVAERYRQKGIGKDMLFFLVRHYQNTKFAFIDLEVLKTNFSAISFYKKHSFIAIEEHGNKYLMRKNLN